MAPTSTFPNAIRPLLVLASLALVLWLLSWLQPVLIPIALAMLLTFMLSPVVTIMQRRRVPRALAVLCVVLVAFSFIATIGYLVAQQVSSLIDSFPQYESNLQQKIESLRTNSGFVDKLQGIVNRITRQIEREQTNEAEGVAHSGSDTGITPLPVTVITGGGPFQLGRIWSLFGPVLEPFAAVGLAVVLVIFMLLRREDLRDRIIGLVGHGQGRLTLTTRALDEAGERISRFLLMQLIINASYGAVVGVGLFFIGVPYAFLWGFFAAVFRYIPYLGPWLAAILPIGISLLVSPGWTAPILVIVLFLILELVSNMIMEPWLYGRGIGISETATLVMIAFWTWIWGPVGLVLATPLTVCVVVLGRYVPFLRFFDTLLGDRPALEPHVSYYQRLLARDDDEASEIARTYLGEHSLRETYDGLLIPALARAKRDAAEDHLPEDDERFALDATSSVVEELATLAKAVKKDKAEPASTVAAKPSPSARMTVVACPARDEADETAVSMLKELIDPTRADVTAVTHAMLANEIVALVGETGAGVLCIMSLPPGGIAQARLLCLRLRTRFPSLKIVVARLGLTDVTKLREQLTAAGVDDVTTSIGETVDLVESLSQLNLPAADEPSTEPGEVIAGAELR